MTELFIFPFVVVVVVANIKIMVVDEKYGRLNWRLNWRLNKRVHW